jgi:hypothetical protein
LEPQFLLEQDPLRGQDPRTTLVLSGQLQTTLTTRCSQETFRNGVQHPGWLRGCGGSARRAARARRAPSREPSALGVVARRAASPPQRGRAGIRRTSERTSGGLGLANASREPLGLGGGLLAGRGAEVQRSYVGSHDTAAGIPRRIASPQISERTFRSWGLSGWVAKNQTRSSSSSASKNGPLKDRRTSQDQKCGGFWEPLWELGTLELSDEWTVVLRLRDRRHEWEWFLARRTFGCESPRVR